MNVIDKLQIKADMIGVVMGEPRGVSLGLGRSRRRRDLDFVVVFAARASDVIKKGVPALAACARSPSTTTGRPCASASGSSSARSASWHL